MDATHRGLDRLLDDIAGSYDVGQWWDVQPAGNGFRIAAEAGEFLAEVSDGRSDASLRFEAMLLNHLADKAFVAPRLVRTRAGWPWHRSSAGESILVTEWLQGGEVDAFLPHHRVRAVRALAGYHSAVRSFPPRLRVDGGPTLFTLEQDGPDALEAFAGISGWHLDVDGRRRLRSASSYLWRQFVRVSGLLHAGGATLPRLVIHGDFGPDAVVLDEAWSGVPGDGLRGFATGRYDARVVDLAAALETFGRVAGQLDLDRCAALVAAYDEVDRLSPGEVRALPLILRVERLVRVFRLTSGFVARFSDGPRVADVIADIADVVEAEAARLRWLERHEPAFLEAVGSSLVG